MRNMNSHKENNENNILFKGINVSIYKSYSYNFSIKESDNSNFSHVYKMQFM